MLDQAKLEWERLPVAAKCASVREEDSLSL
jgi:hypothetical protein